MRSTGKKTYYNVSNTKGMIYKPSKTQDIKKQLCETNNIQVYQKVFDMRNYLSESNFKLLYEEQKNINDQLTLKLQNKKQRLQAAQKLLLQKEQQYEDLILEHKRNFAKQLKKQQLEIIKINDNVCEKINCLKQNVDALKEDIKKIRQPIIKIHKEYYAKERNKQYLQKLFEKSGAIIKGGMDDFQLSERLQIYQALKFTKILFQPHQFISERLLEKLQSQLPDKYAKSKEVWLNVKSTLFYQKVSDITIQINSVIILNNLRFQQQKQKLQNIIFELQRQKIIFQNKTDSENKNSIKQIVRQQIVIEEQKKIIDQSKNDIGKYEALILKLFCKLSNTSLPFHQKCAINLYKFIDDNLGRIKLDCHSPYQLYDLSVYTCNKKEKFIQLSVNHTLLQQFNQKRQYQTKVNYQYLQKKQRGLNIIQKAFNIEQNKIIQRKQIYTSYQFELKSRKSKNKGIQLNYEYQHSHIKNKIKVISAGLLFSQQKEINWGISQIHCLVYMPTKKKKINQNNCNILVHQKKYQKENNSRLFQIYEQLPKYKNLLFTYSNYKFHQEKQPAYRLEYQYCILINYQHQIARNIEQLYDVKQLKKNNFFGIEYSNSYINTQKVFKRNISFYEQENFNILMKLQKKQAFCINWNYARQQSKKEENQNITYKVIKLKKKLIQLNYYIQDKNDLIQENLNQTQHKLFIISKTKNTINNYLDTLYINSLQESISQIVQLKLEKKWTEESQQMLQQIQQLKQKNVELQIISDRTIHDQKQQLIQYKHQCEQLQQYKKKHQDNKQQMEIYINQIKKIKAENQQLTKTIQESNTQVNQQKNMVQLINNYKSDINNMAQEKDELITQQKILTQQKEELTLQIQELQTEKINIQENYNSEIFDQKKRLSSCQKQYQGLMKDNDEMIEQYKQLNQNYQNIILENKELQKTMQEINKEKQYSSSQYEQIKLKHQTLQQDYENQQKRIFLLTEELEKKVSEFTYLEQQYDILNELKNQYQTFNQQTQDEAKIINNEKKQLIQQLQQLNNNNLFSQNKMQNALQKLDSIKIKMNNYDKIYINCQIENYIKRISKLQMEIEQAKNIFIGREQMMKEQINQLIKKEECQKLKKTEQQTLIEKKLKDKNKKRKKVIQFQNEQLQLLESQIKQYKQKIQDIKKTSSLQLSEQVYNNYISDIQYKKQIDSQDNELKDLNEKLQKNKEISIEQQKIHEQTIRKLECNVQKQKEIISEQQFANDQYQEIISEQKQQYNGIQLQINTLKEQYKQKMNDQKQIFDMIIDDQRQEFIELQKNNQDLTEFLQIKQNENTIMNEQLNRQQIDQINNNNNMQTKNLINIIKQTMLKLQQIQQQYDVNIDYQKKKYQHLKKKLVQILLYKTKTIKQLEYQNKQINNQERQHIIMQKQINKLNKSEIVNKKESYKNNAITHLIQNYIIDLYMEGLQNQIFKIDNSKKQVLQNYEISNIGIIIKISKGNRREDDKFKNSDNVSQVSGNLEGQLEEKQQETQWLCNQIQLVALEMQKMREENEDLKMQLETVTTQLNQDNTCQFSQSNQIGVNQFLQTEITIEKQEKQINNQNEKLRKYESFLQNINQFLNQNYTCDLLNDMFTFLKQRINEHQKMSHSQKQQDITTKEHIYQLKQLKSLLSEFYSFMQKSTEQSPGQINPIIFSDNKYFDRDLQSLRNGLRVIRKQIMKDGQQEIKSDTCQIISSLHQINKAKILRDTIFMIQRICIIKQKQQIGIMNALLSEAPQLERQKFYSNLMRICELSTDTQIDNQTDESQMMNTLLKNINHLKSDLLKLKQLQQSIGGEDKAKIENSLSDIKLSKIEPEIEHVNNENENSIQEDEQLLSNFKTKRLDAIKKNLFKSGRGRKYSAQSNKSQYSLQMKQKDNYASQFSRTQNSSYLQLTINRQQQSLLQVKQQNYEQEKVIEELRKQLSHFQHENKQNMSDFQNEQVKSSLLKLLQMFLQKNKDYKFVLDILCNHLHFSQKEKEYLHKYFKACEPIKKQVQALFKNDK